MNDKLRGIINEIVEQYFTSLKARFIGPQAVSHSVMFQVKEFDPKATLLYAYMHANSIHSSGRDQDRDSMKKLIATTSHFMDSIKIRTQADIGKQISDQLDVARRQAKIEDEDPSQWLKSDAGERMIEGIRKDLEDQRQKIVKSVELTMQVGLSDAQNIGAADGILAVAQRMGISDPVVFKIGVLDEKRCKDCWRLWTMEDKKTPRLYRLSELGADPGRKAGDRQASITLTHPNCRDILTVLMPGFGFDTLGRVIYRGRDHDEITRQRADGN